MQAVAVRGTTHARVVHKSCMRRVRREGGTTGHVIDSVKDHASLDKVGLRVTLVWDLGFSSLSLFTATY